MDINKQLQHLPNDRCARLCNVFQDTSCINVRKQQTNMRHRVCEIPGPAVQRLATIIILGKQYGLREFPRSM
eukprot:scaffold181711_cov42-Prasinocladus_malaysianus.AAC.1